MTTPDEMREAFERWYLREFGAPINDHSTQLHGWTHLVWKGAFEEATALAERRMIERCAKVCEEIALASVPCAPDTRKAYDCMFAIRALGAEKKADG